MVNPRSLVIFKPQKETERGEKENIKKNTGANGTRGAVHSLREHQQGVKLPEIAPDLARRRVDAKPAAGPAARFTPRLGEIPHGAIRAVIRAAAEQRHGRSDFRCQAP